MRYSTHKFLKYIFEDSTTFGSPSSTSFKPPKRTAKKPTPTTPANKSSSSTTTNQSRPKPMMDPSVMGKGGKNLPPDVISTVEELSKASKGIFQSLPSGGSSLVGAAATKAGIDIAANLPKRSEMETRAQQEGIYNMTNVRQFYKNLGAETIPLRPPPGQELLTKVMGILTGGTKATP